MKKIIGTILFVTHLFSPLMAREKYITSVDHQKAPFELPPLPYAFDALEPYLEKEILEIHHNKHHKTYVENLNKAILGTEWEKKTLLELFKEASKLPAPIRNNGGGHWNHSLYWVLMTNDPEKRKMPERLEKELVKYFGSVDQFKERFIKAGVDCFGSGYTWLVRAPDGSLQVSALPNQDNPMMDNVALRGIPLLNCDVWEHAYYLQYQNRRADYLNAFWNLVNWQEVDFLAFDHVLQN